MSELRSRLLRRLHKTQKRLAQVEQLLLEALNWKKTHHEADLLQSYFHQLVRGRSEITLPDWEQEGRLVTLHLDPRIPPKEIVAKRYKKARKEERSIPHLEKERAFLLQKQEEWERWLALCEEDEQLAKEALPPPPLPPEKRPPPLPFRSFTTKSGLAILVGRNAKENEELTFKVAHGTDWWFHIDGESGSHVVLRVPKNQEADQDAMRQAMETALHFSKGRGRQEGRIIYARVKHLRRPRGGKLGQVLVAQPHFAQVTLIPKSTY
ncbi:MAG: DUF814 domain-containing protein [Verrucomicrobia bacterium]|nr:DUF814 domain-containing protein [Verrucomicrobiota bacterium]